MGKASRRKKAKKGAQQQQPRKEPRSIKKNVKKTASPKNAKVTLEALEKKAADVETALDKALHKAEEVVAEKEDHAFREYLTGIKESAKELLEDFRAGIDPEKLKTLQQETKAALKKGAVYAVGIMAVVTILMVVELQSNGRVFPSTRAGGVDISFLPLPQAREKLSTEISQYLAEPIIFSFEGDTFEVPAGELGLQISVEQTLGRIPVLEFEKQNPAYLLATVFTSRSVAGDYVLDGDKIIKVLEDKLQLGGRRARSARLVLGDEGFHVEAESAGVAINREELIKDLRDNINRLSTGTIEVHIQEETPRITAEELEKDKERLLGLLTKTVHLSSGDESTSIKLSDHLDAVSFEEKNALTIEGRTTLPLVLGEGQFSLAHANPVAINSNVQIGLDPEKLEEYLRENLIKNIEKPVSPAKIYQNEEGKVMIEGKGEDGKSVPVDRLVEAIALAANNNIDNVPVPVLVDKAPLEISEGLQELGIKELIATGHSAYYGSPPNRMYNIEFGTNKYNGLLIAPGEEFSFNAHLGEVDARSGFLPEKVIKQNKLELEYGGGICQVSTTMYRAALLAGLPITERRPHSWKVSYYGQSMGHGLDATIYPGVTDLKFLNDTPGHLLIQSYTEGAEAYFKIYGTSDGRTTIMDGPYGGGLSYRWNRTVKKNGEEIKEEIWSQYRPIPPPEPPPQPKPAPTPAPAENGF